MFIQIVISMPQALLLQVRFSSSPPVKPLIVYAGENEESDKIPTYVHEEDARLIIYEEKKNGSGSRAAERKKESIENKKTSIYVQ